MQKGNRKEPRSVLDAVSRLLLEREADLQGALEIYRNDILQREADLNSLKAIGSPSQTADDALAKMISDTRRGRRDAVSERGYLFENDLRNYAIGRGKLGDVNKTEAGERKRSQPIPGTEAHHPASVSSTEALVQNMDAYEIRRLWQIAADNGYTVGSEADGFIPLSKPAHTTGGKNWGPDYAHAGKDGQPDPGRFKTEPLPKGTTASQAWAYLQPVLEEQRVLNERAYNHPMEQRMRADAEKIVGKPIEWKGPVTIDRAVTNAQAKSQGVNATTITKAYDRNPLLMSTNEVPNVTIAVPGGARVPKPLTRPEKPPSIKVGRSPGNDSPPPFPTTTKPTPIPTKPTDIPQSNTNLLRIARNTAPLWASIPLSTMVAGQSAQAAIKKPNVNNLVDAGFDGVSALLDVASIVPALAAPAEGIQKAMIVPQAAWEGYKATQGRKNKPLPRPPVKLSAAQIRTFQAGGGQAAMLRDGLTREQVIERGSALLLKQKHG